MTDREKWAAICRNDAGCDGLFFYAVKSTGIFCRPSCKSRAPRRENVRFFDTAEHAREANFRPCKRCRPDLPSYEPIAEIAQSAKELIDATFRQKQMLAERLCALGITQHRMAEIFKEQFGLSLPEYVSGLRLVEAKRLLVETDDAVIDIADAVGFGSLSAFYRFWSARMEVPPLAYRKTTRRSADE